MPPTEAPAQEEPLKPVDPYAPPMEPPTEPPMEPPTEPPMEPSTEPPMPEPMNPYAVPAEPATEAPEEAPLPAEPIALPPAAPAMVSSFYY
ncbi:hypothetical protein ANCDUO_05459 [Ancylostoma duodenale]|uniref:Uncharacterized protein n=1 Tax=Ancylostoma duodenale TaxID=51022 RepID=A0A0C2GSF7_9BILA|nr:hypothetical protein ANCDUO_05459 [Ancylostoma duodenale]